MKQIFIFLLFVLTSCSDRYDLVISKVNIVDISTGNISTADLLIRDSLIVEINSSSFSYNADEELNGTGYYAIPSFWDMHVHIQDSSYLSMFLDFGITGVRDMGGCLNKPGDGCESLCPEVLNKWKKEMLAGRLEGPDLFIAGKQLSGTGWPTALPVLTKDQVKQAFKENLKENVDFIKVYENIPWESYQEIAGLSREYDLDFAGHVSEPFLLSDILDLGQKSIEHIREPILYSFTNDSLELEQFMEADGYSPEDREYVKAWIEDAENVINSFKRNVAWFTPTMAVQYSRFRYKDREWIEHPLREKMPSSVNQGMQKHLQDMMASEDHKGDSLWWMALTKLVRRFSNEQIGILAGSDSACEGVLPGYSLHEELFLMVEEAGLTPLEALQTTTLNPALYFEIHNKGRINKNYYANLVLLKDNPLANIRNTLSIKAVIKNGKVVRLNQ